MNNKKFTQVFLVLCLFSMNFLSYTSQAQELDFSNQALQRLASPAGTSNWIHFNSGVDISATSVFQIHQAAFGLGANDEMKLLKKETDQLGFTHYRFQQLHQDLEVEAAEFIIHEKGGKALKANGNIIRNLKVSQNPSISKDKAIALAKAYLPAKEYMWEDSAAEDLLKELKKDHLASYLPQPKLMIAWKDINDLRADNYALAYKIDIHAKVPHASEAIYVDAHSGIILKTHSLIKNCDPGEGCTLFNGDRGILTTQLNSTVYELRDECTGVTVRKGITFRRILNFTGNDWFLDTDCEHVSAHWALSETTNYYMDKHQRDGYDNAGSMIVAATQNDQYGADNASWDLGLNVIRLGPGGGGLAHSPIVSVDVVAHEFTHGVIQFSAGLSYMDEPGALNESFADIFGTMVEFYGTNDPNYFIGEDVWIEDGFLRSFSDPKSKTEVLNIVGCPGNELPLAQPDTYGGDYWKLPGTCDQGGVHINSGVQNHWFYLLAEGSSDTDEINDNGDSFSLTGIGNERAAMIAYRALSVYLIQSSKFQDARVASVQAAGDIFGACSFEQEETERAWDAVGVYDNNPPAGCTIEGPSYVNCVEVYTTPVIPGVSDYGWNFSHPCATIIPSGNTVKVVGIDCEEGDYGDLCIEPVGGCNITCCITIKFVSCDQDYYFREDLTTEASTIQITPNPADDELTVTLSSNSEEIQLSLFDLSGKLLKDIYQKNQNQIMLNVQDLESGMYMLKVKTPNNTYTEKIVKR